MKNRKKALIIAIICLAAAAVLYLLVVKLSQRSEDADSSDDSLVISSVDSGQITAISYEKDGKSLSFRKEDGGFSYPKTGFTGRFVGIWSGFAGIDCAIYGQ